MKQGLYDFERFVTIEIIGSKYDIPDFIVEPGDYQLKESSPCIDAGTSEGAPESDIEGNERPSCGGIDMGAYEFTGCQVIEFLRGEINMDGDRNIADVVFILKYYFAGGDEPACLDAADCNDDGQVNIADAVSLLAYLFGGAGPLPAPFDTCDIDLTEDELGCKSFPSCLEP